MAGERPLFTGSVEHSLDDKGRLVVPARFRERLGSGFFITIADPDQCLALYPASTFREFSATLEAAPDKDKDYRTFLRNVFANTEEVSCDNQGRLVLPPVLRAWAHIEKDVVSIGALSRIEVWSKARYAEVVTADHSQTSDLRSKLGLY